MSQQNVERQINTREVVGLFLSIVSSLSIHWHHCIFKS